MNTFAFLSGIAVGIILFQSALIAPTVLKTLDAKATSNFLRAIWPKFFVVLSVIGGAAAIANAIYNACGARLYDYPMTPDRVIAAMPD